MNLITPFVGCKVNFYSDDRALYRNDDKTPFAATVAYVHGPSRVNLLVVDHEGNTHTRTNVTLTMPSKFGESHGDGTYATWRPIDAWMATETA